MHPKGLEQALDLQDQLTDLLGIESVFAGGCARDLFFGLEPKDYDLVVSVEDFRWQEIPELCLALQLDTTEYNFYKFDDQDKFDRIHKCIKVQLKDTTVDVLVYKCASAEEAVNHFDTNLNQFVISRTHKLYNAVPVFVGQVPLSTGLRTVRPDASMSRRHYVSQKAQSLGISTQEFDVETAILGGSFTNTLGINKQ